MSIDVEPVYDYDTQCKLTAVWLTSELPPLMDTAFDTLEKSITETVNRNGTVGELVTTLITGFEQAIADLKVGREKYGGVSIDDAAKYTGK